MTDDSGLEATGSAWLVTPLECERLALPIQKGWFVCGIDRKCGTPSVCQVESLQAAVTMLTALNIETLQIFCVRAEERLYYELAAAQEAMDHGVALH